MSDSTKNPHPNHHDPSATLIASENEAISNLTAELLCNPTIKPLYLAALRDEDVGADKLYDRLRYDLRSLGLFLKAEDGVLWSFAEALRDEAISDGIASAIVAYANALLVRDRENAAAIGDTATLSLPAPTLNLPLLTIEALLAREAYVTLTPTLVEDILDSKRYTTLGLNLLNTLSTAYSVRLATALGPDAIGEDGTVLRWSRFQSVVDELAATPPRCICFAAEGTKAAEVKWSTMREGARKIEAPRLREGYCRVKWTARNGFVRFVDVRVARLGGLMEAIDGAPRMRGWAR
jgi:hypothetical protein